MKKFEEVINFLRDTSKFIRIYRWKDGVRMKINEDNFIGELKNKNPKALDYLVDNYSNLIFKVVISVLGSDKREEAMECLNDVLLKVWEK